MVCKGRTLSPTEVQYVFYIQSGTGKQSQEDSFVTGSCDMFALGLLVLRNDKAVAFVNLGFV